MKGSVALDRKSGTNTLGRALDILFALSEANGTLSVSEIAEKVSIPESSTYRFLQTLEKNGIVERRGKNQIGLGLRILDLARSLNQQIHRELLSLALPIMINLMESTQETSLLFVRTGNDAVCIQHVKGRGLIQFVIENGRRLPLHQGASGKSILAFENEKTIEQVVANITNDRNRSDLIDSLKAVKEQGFACTEGEYDPDVFAIGAPVLDSHGLVVASLSIAGPLFRGTKERIPEMINSVMESSKHLSNLLGGE
ncbi:IclR family transcriptional regulator [Paenibacillus tundrae]|uniref:IclR family transcriptional regulator n=1 Tax=Paenibacillus tundrae TaxID=528187 RepID=UPI0022A8EC04|nr:IclR family transcriptional regulator [Paenibacillus tundrae]MCZ1268862.1 IclR family transcriptional regulator [Paenibacillus tundrae]